MFEVLAHSEEVARQVVVGGEVLHLCLYLCGGLFCVVDQAAAIADFSVEHLASAHCLVRFDKVDDVVRHTVVASPWYVFHLVADDDGGDVVLFLEDFTRLGSEGGGFVGAGDWGNGCWGRIEKIAHVLLF